MASLHQDENPLNSPRFELASLQASLAFERTIIALDQSLMGAVRTSLALVSFGFAMVLFIRHSSLQFGTDMQAPAREFALFLLAMGMILLIAGLLGHRKRFYVLKLQMDELHRRSLLTENCPYRWSMISIFAVGLLIAALVGMTGVLVRIGPFA